MVIQVMHREEARLVGIYEVDAAPRLYDTVRIANDVFVVVGTTWVLDAKRSNQCILFVVTK